MPFMELASIAVAVFIGAMMAAGSIHGMIMWDRDKQNGIEPRGWYLSFPIGCFLFTLLIVLGAP